VGAAIAVTIGAKGAGVLSVWESWWGRLYLAQALFVLLVLVSALTDRARAARPLLPGRAPAILLAFSTASSEAALPLALENMERMGIPKHIGRFCAAHGI